MKKAKKCILLLSGGLDSVTTLAYAIDQNYEVLCVSFQYGQTHGIEIEYAKKNAKKYNSEHKIIDLSNVFNDFQSSLLGKEFIPKDKIDDATIPNTYVPCRNIIFLSIVSGLAQSSQINEIFIGANAVDYSGYPDCRPEFIKSFEKMINIGTGLENEDQIRIRTPLIDLKKSAIIKLGLSLAVDYSITTSCYDTKNGIACRKCPSCRIRLDGFVEAKTLDPIEYFV